MKRFLLFLLTLHLAAFAATDYTVWAPDDDKVIYGDGSDFAWKFNSVNSRLECVDAAGNVLGYWEDLGTTGKFVATGSVTAPQITSTVATGTAPLVIASTTKVANLDVDKVDGGDWAAPGAQGTGTPNTGIFTTLSANSQIKASTANPVDVAVVGDHNESTVSLWDTDATTITFGGDAVDMTIGPGTLPWAGDEKLRLDFDYSVNLNTNIIDNTDTTFSLFPTPTTVTMGPGTSSTLSLNYTTIKTSLSSTSGTFYRSINSNAGTAALASLEVANADDANDAFRLICTGGSFTSSGAFKGDAGTLLAGANLGGGMSIAARHASGDVRLYAGGVADADLVATFADDQSSTFEGAATIKGNTTLGGALTVNGNTQLGDSSADRIGLGVAPGTNRLLLGNGSLEFFKGTKVDVASNNADLQVWQNANVAGANARVIFGQDASNFARWEWVTDYSTPANGYAKFETSGGAGSVAFLPAGNLVKFGTSQRTWNEATGYILGGAINPDSVTDTQLSDVATAGTYNGVTITTAGRVTSANKGSIEFCLSDGVAATGSPVLGTDSGRKCWAYDATSAEVVTFTTTVPWTANGVTAFEPYLNWHAAATANECVWVVSCSIVANDGSIAYGTAQETVHTVSPNTNANNITTFINPLSVSAVGGRLLVVKVERFANDAEDDMAGDAFLDGVQLRF